MMLMTSTINEYESKLEEKSVENHCFDFCRFYEHDATRNEYYIILYNDAPHSDFLHVPATLIARCTMTGDVRAFTPIQHQQKI